MYLYLQHTRAETSTYIERVFQYNKLRVKFGHFFGSKLFPSLQFQSRTILRLCPQALHKKEQ